jgi:putative flippase GtrA
MTGARWRQIARFVMVGGVATLVYLTVTIGCQTLAQAGPAVSSGIGFAVSIACSYLGHALFTFDQQGVALASGLRFAVATLLIAGCLSLLHGYLVNAQNWPAPIAALLNAMLYPAMSFLAHSLWSFSGRGHRGRVV